MVTLGGGAFCYNYFTAFRYSEDKVVVLLLSCWAGGEFFLEEYLIFLPTNCFSYNVADCPLGLEPGTPLIPMFLPFLDVEHSQPTELGMMGL